MIADMDSRLSELDPVAVTVDLPAEGLVRGSVGTVVRVHAPGVYEVEFVDEKGRTYRLTTLTEQQVLPLVYEKLSVA